jgi:hypothetical protein
MILLPLSVADEDAIGPILTFFSYMYLYRALQLRISTLIYHV